jgi:hypothetical protein
MLAVEEVPEYVAAPPAVAATAIAAMAPRVAVVVAAAPAAVAAATVVAKVARQKHGQKMGLRDKNHLLQFTEHPPCETYLQVRLRHFQRFLQH